MSLGEDVNATYNNLIAKDLFKGESKMLLGGITGAFLPSLVGVYNPIASLYSAGLGFTAMGTDQLDSLVGKLTMAGLSLGYFLPKTLESIGYGLSVPSASLGSYVSSAASAVGLGSVTSYIGSALSSIAPYLPAVCTGLASLGFAYFGYKVAKGLTDKFFSTEPKGEQKKKEPKTEGLKKENKKPEPRVEEPKA